MPIRDFLRAQISRLKGEKEIPRRLWLLAEATKKLEDGDDEEGTEGAGGPYGTILHTASVVGNDWLVKLQIQAGVDVSAFDNHFWTALMVAKAQGHTSCANLLAEHMEPGEANAAPQALGPSGFVKAGPKTSISMSSVVLKEGVQFRSDHPIPPHCRTFYYEIKILDNGPLGCVYTIGLKLLYTNRNFLVSLALAYADQRHQSIVCLAGTQLLGVTMATMDINTIVCWEQG